MQMADIHKLQRLSRGKSAARYACFTVYTTFSACKQAKNAHDANQALLRSDITPRIGQYDNISISSRNGIKMNPMAETSTDVHVFEHQIHETDADASFLSVGGAEKVEWDSIVPIYPHVASSTCCCGYVSQIGAKRAHNHDQRRRSLHLQPSTRSLSGSHCACNPLSRHLLTSFPS